MLRTGGLVMTVALLMVACGGGGGGGTTVETMAAPSDLRYGLGTGEVGTPYGPYPPSVTGTVTAYSVTPALPAGLTLDPASGAISGTPLTASPAATYTVTASNAAGRATVVLTLVVLAGAPPTALSYAASPENGTVGSPLSPVVPTLTGHADAFTVFPPLPAGLTLDPVTGIVSGTPTGARPFFKYIVTASAMDGSFTNAELFLTIGMAPPGITLQGVFRSDTVIGLGYVSGSQSGLTDTNGAFTYETGQPVTFSVGAVNIGAVPTAKALVTPVDLAAQGTGTSNRVLNVVRFLMMLDQDGNANNGIQISAAVTAAAAGWAPVDFDTTDLPAALGPIIQQASAADGGSHVLPDAVTAQAHLRTAFYCTHAGTYYGSFGPVSPNPLSVAGFDFTASVFPDGSMQILDNNATVSALLDGSFAENGKSPGAGLTGSFADATYLSGTYPADREVKFAAVGDASVTAAYKFTGSLTSTPDGNPDSRPVNLWMDDSNQVSGSIGIYRLAGTVSGNTFTGTVDYFRADSPHQMLHYPASGTYSNTDSGITFDGQYTTNETVVTFSTAGCRAN